MDLGKYSVSNEPIEMPILDPVSNAPALTDDGRPMAFKVVGLDSDQVNQYDLQVSRNRLKAANFARMKSTITPEQIKAEQFNRTCVCVVGFSNIVVNAEELVYSPAEVQKLLKDYPFLRDQVDEFVGDRTNFFKPA